MDIDERLAVAYGTAMHTRGRYNPGTVEIHVGIDVYTHLKSLAIEEDERVKVPGRPTWTIWGFPLVLDRAAQPDAISVHTVQVILP